MSNTDRLQLRQPPGRPTGGQFAETARAASGLTLASEARTRLVRTLRTVTSWEDGLDRDAFDQALPGLGSKVRDAAWESVTYLASRHREAHQGEHIDYAHDEVSQRAHEDAVDTASNRTYRSAEGWDEAVVESYAEGIVEGYGAELEHLIHQLAGAQHGQQLAYAPVRTDLPHVGRPVGGAAA